tara:strand:+ start:2336 stop:2941 length:606 start_codon:yes stop_codon:yes gene_type:complete
VYQDIRKKNRKLLIILSLVAISMFGFGYALVPIYNTFCQAFGINGKTSGRYLVPPSMEADKSRTIKVTFSTTLNREMPWDFRTNKTVMLIHPGEIKQVDFFAKNLTNKAIIGRAIPSISPGQLGTYFHKTECFCFNEQLLSAKEERVMPLVFFIDPSIPKDIYELTLSYTMFDTKKETQEDKDKIINILENSKSLQHAVKT